MAICRAKFLPKNPIQNLFMKMLFAMSISGFYLANAHFRGSTRTIHNSCEKFTTSRRSSSFVASSPNPTTVYASSVPEMQA